MRQARWLAGLVLGLTATLALGGTSDLWIHVKVEDDGGRGEKVNINIPLSLVEEVLPLLEHDLLRDGKLRLDDLDIDLASLDLREMWRSIRDLDDAEFVRIESDDEDVRVFKEGEFLLVEIADHHDIVNVRIPLQVVGALFSGDPGELDVLAAVEALGRHGQGDLVQVEDGSSRVRIWIDDRNESD